MSITGGSPSAATTFVPPLDNAADWLRWWALGAQSIRAGSPEDVALTLRAGGGEMSACS